MKYNNKLILLTISIVIINSVALSTASLDFKNPAQFSFAQLFSATAQQFLPFNPLSQQTNTPVNQNQVKNQATVLSKSEPQQDIKQAYQKLYEFGLADPQIKNALQSGTQLTEQQNKRVANYILTIPYFQNDIIQQFIKKSDNQWLKSLSKDAQLKYIKLVAPLTPKDFNDQQKIGEIKKQIQNQLQISKQFEEFMSKNPSANPLSANAVVFTSNYL